MIYSMTGFGKASSSYNGFSIEVEAKSFNNRFLEASIKLPSSLQNRELEFKELVREKTKRGKILLNILVKAENNGSLLAFNEVKLEESILTIKKIGKAIKSKEKIKIAHLLSIKDIFTPEQVEYEDELINTIKNTIISALDALNKMRLGEGSLLENDLEKRIKIINENVAFIEDSFEKGIKEHYERLKLRLAQIIEDVTKYSDRLETELAILADKADITEECVRLKSHTKFFIENLKSDASGEVGRKLNFICQEMHREANTIASKSISSEVIHSSVKIREEIERIREQIQNIE